MKSFLTLSLLVLSTFTFAQSKVTIADKHIDINDTQATLVRTAASPDKVKIKLSVPCKYNRCVETRIRYVYGQNGAYCGYDIGYAQQCSQQCRPARPPHGQEDPSKIPQVCERVCRPVEVRHARSCNYPAGEECIRTEVATTNVEDQVTIKFKDGGLGGSEEEEYLLTGSQKSFGSMNVGFDLKATKVQGEVEIKSTDILGIGDTITVKR